MSTSIRTRNSVTEIGGVRRLAAWVLLATALAIIGPAASRADTVASLLGNFTINQYCGLKLESGAVDVHYVVVFGQLPAIRELHQADANGDGVTSQAERDAYVATLAPGIAAQLPLEIDGVAVPLHATHWTSSLPSEQGGFSLRVDVDFSADVPLELSAPAERTEDAPSVDTSTVDLPGGVVRTGVAPGATDARAHTLRFENQNYRGRLGWHEIVVQTSPGLAVYDTNAYSTSLTGGLTQALKSLPADGPLDERTAYLRFEYGRAPVGAVLLAPRPGIGTPIARSAATAVSPGALIPSDWIARKTRRLVDGISGPRLEARAALWALLGALLLGAVHALSPGHGKTLVGAYLVGSRGTPRHAVFLGLTVTVTHTLGVFVLGFATLYASRFVVPERLFPILSLISALLVLGMGMVLLVQRARSARQALATSPRAPVKFYALQPVPDPRMQRGLLFAPAHHGRFDGTLHAHGGRLHSHLPPDARGEKVTWRSLLALGISGGLVPCPSALVLLLAAVALNKAAYGMLLVAAFSAGLALTLTAIGMTFLYARNRLRAPAAGARWPHLLPLLSAGTITVLGLGLCIGALMSFRS